MLFMHSCMQLHVMQNAIMLHMYHGDPCLMTIYFEFATACRLSQAEAGEPVYSLYTYVTYI